MYQFSNQQLYHHNHYQQCQLNIEDTIKHNVNTIPEPQFHHIIQSVPCTDSLQIDNTKECNPPPEATNQKKKKNILKKLKVPKSGEEIGKEKKDKPGLKKTSVDTSTFTIEERLVAGVWVHERTHTNTTIGEIKNNFRKRFGREPPSKTTLLTWERKLFSTGNVCDAPRTGRPVNRKNRVSEVAASLRAAPALSLRARALQLQLPRSTLHNILRNDLPYVAKLNGAEKLPSKKSTGPLKSEVTPAPVQSAPCPPPAPPPPPPPPHYAAVHTHATHSHVYP